MFFGHTWELLIVLVIALVFFGPKRLPELGSSLGKGIREFRKATNELQDSIKTDTSEPLPPERPASPAERTQFTAGAYTGQQAHTAEYTAPPAQAAPIHPVEPVHPVENEPPRA